MLHMEQKNYKLEIVRVLDRKGVYARGVAVRLDKNLGKLDRDEELSKGWVQIEHPLSIDTAGGRLRRYWADLKIKLKEEGIQLYDKIGQLKLESSDGKMRHVGVNQTSPEAALHVTGNMKVGIDNNYYKGRLSNMLDLSL